MAKWLASLIVISTLFGLAQEVEAVPLPPNVLLNLRGHAQQMPLSCESRSAVDLAAFWGVSIPEREFFDRLPKTDNPHTGFVGDVYDWWGQLPPNGYGVYAEPVAELLRAYGLPAEVQYGLGLDWLRAELAAGRPVIIWATPRMATQPVVTYTASDGQEVSVIRYEHTVTAVGYTQWAVYVVDSANGYRWAYDNQALLNAWNKLGQMSVVVYGSSHSASSASPVTVASPPTNATVTTTSPPTNATIILKNPPPDGVVRVPMEVRGTIQMPNFHYYKIWYGVGDNPSSWVWVSGPHPLAVQDGLITQHQFARLTPGRYTIRIVVNGIVARGKKDEKVAQYVRFTVVP